MGALNREGGWFQTAKKEGVGGTVDVSSKDAIKLLGLWIEKDLRNSVCLRDRLYPMIMIRTLYIYIQCAVLRWGWGALIFGRTYFIC